MIIFFLTDDGRLRAELDSAADEVLLLGLGDGNDVELDLVLGVGLEVLHGEEVRVAVDEGRGAGHAGAGGAVAAKDDKSKKRSENILSGGICFF